MLDSSENRAKTLQIQTPCPNTAAFLITERKLDWTGKMHWFNDR